ncbi:sodium-dependent bicarbonate transport family permease [Acidimicrobiaceae bacterium]|nr:sodium-dependent bicarbonate transport family permease [Acidimicrobiaceae bacterium]
MEAILNPAIILFISGIIIGRIFNDTLPQALSKYLGYYLLLSLGLKGGISLQQNGFTSEVVNAISLGIFFALLIPILSYLYLRNILNIDDAAALSGTYGSVSAITFVTAISYLSTNSQAFDDYMSAVLVVMEFPAIFMALFLITRKRNVDQNNFEIIKTAFLEVPNVLLISSLIIGFSIQGTISDNVEFFTDTLFEYVLYLFLFVMGTRVAKRLKELKGKGITLILFALITPLIGSLLALFASNYFALSIGNATLLMVLTASASYIAVPAVVKDAIPDANPAIYLGLSLGVTFPFNIIIGIPVYHELAKYFIG